MPSQIRKDYYVNEKDGVTAEAVTKWVSQYLSEREGVLLTVPYPLYANEMTAGAICLDTHNNLTVTWSDKFSPAHQYTVPKADFRRMMSELSKGKARWFTVDADGRTMDSGEEEVDLPRFESPARLGHSIYGNPSVSWSTTVDADLPKYEAPKTKKPKGNDAQS